MPSRVKPAIIKLLESGYKGTADDFSQKVFCHIFVSRRILKELHSSNVIRICKWHFSKIRFTPVFAKSNGKSDAQKPVIEKPKKQLKPKRITLTKDQRKTSVSEWLEKKRSSHVK